MIISRAPCRLTLGGGGTDLPSYYRQRGGFTITGAVDKYVFVSAYKQFYPDVILKYSELEHVDDTSDVKHDLFRAALQEYRIRNGIELTSLADVPARTGLGSSGAFLISLLNTLHQYQQKHDGSDRNISKRELARTACDIELNRLKLHEGKQDKYACAFGGIHAFEFNKDDSVSILTFPDQDYLMSELQSNLYLFYTGTERHGTASKALEYQDNKCKENDDMMIDKLDQIRDIGYKTKHAFQTRNLDSFGRLLNDHWEIKKQYSPYASDKFIDNCYSTALDYGALGGKLIGAGGGGFLMFYHPGEIKDRWAFIDEMIKLGLQRTDFRFDTEGVSTVFNGY